MALDVEMTGSGAVGPITPGWRVNEYATPVTIGARSSGTGTVNFNAASKPESALVLNNVVMATHERLGMVTGVVRNVSVSGLNTSITHDSPLAKFNADRYIPPMMQGSGWSAIDLVTQLMGEVRLNLGA